MASAVAWPVLFVVLFSSGPAASKPGVIVALDVRNREAASSALVATAVEEARIIWAPHGVVIASCAPACGIDTATVRHVRVMLIGTGTAAGVAMGAPVVLGRTTLDAVGAATATIALDLDAVAAVAERSLDVVTARRADRRAAVVSRILGRTLAHEIGHVVLDCTAHETSGLMRAEIDGRLLAGRDRSQFTLTASDRQRLARATSGGDAPHSSRCHCAPVRHTLC
jgi:hypothetical protein